MSSELQEKYRTLVRRLFEKSRANELDWSLEWGSDPYCKFGSYTIYLKDSQDSDGDPLEVIELRDASDNIVDSFSDMAISGAVSEYGDEVRSYYGLMEKLHSMARRKALGADKAIDDILRDLS